jgi:hypothetical protein
MAEGIEAKDIAEGLHGDAGNGIGIDFRNGPWEEDLQGFSDAAASPSEAARFSA